ncbi:TetR/AcrR family transcriptional regulator [Amycolatopsis pithecellobii]|uniref:TetR/AcrR family transcriptional regulator n=1 Tax=Amycolatopsis pithecellobii TaxID=664692 RepID=UPI0012BA0A97|nr:TetR/AcrR family transcriptional regulator [Amycolatopsis pithecellobii]
MSTTEATTPVLAAVPTARGRRTRAKIVEAGRRVLAERGYFQSTVADLTAESGVALGTLYRYFPNKEAVYGEILESVMEELRESVSGSWTKGEELASLRESSRRYLEAYCRNRKLISGLIDMAAAKPEYDRRWWELRNRTFERKERYLDRVLADGDLDPTFAAVALASMVEQFAFHSFIQSSRYGRPLPDIDDAADTLSRIWYRAIYAERAVRVPDAG